MAISSSDGARQWFTQNRSAYLALVDVVRATLESLLKVSHVDFLSVTGRAKTVDSFAEKIERKGYVNPAKEITDLAGIRVITFIERDVARVCQIIRKSFHVHPDKSLDKAEELDVDRFGYRSFHFVCDLGPDRVKLPEFALYSDLLFEIQVRTVLQHAWAEIEHDRNYKLAGLLPSTLRRRLYSIAGMLEIADREFNDLASEVDAYAKDVAAATKKGDLDVELNSTSLEAFLKSKLTDTPIKLEHRPLLPQVIDELRDYGIASLAELDKILTNRFVATIAKYRPSTTDVGFLRMAMMFDDMEHYFAKAWKHHFSGLAPGSEAMLFERYGENKAKKLLNRYFKLQTKRRNRQRARAKKAGL